MLRNKILFVADFKNKILFVADFKNKILFVADLYVWDFLIVYD